MVPDIDARVRRVLAPLRASRALALVVAVAVGACVLGAAVQYASPGVYEVLLLPIATSGTVYYLVHHEVANWENQASVRSFLRTFVIISIAFWVAPAEAPLLDGIVSYTTALLAMFFVVITVAVDLTESSADAGDGGSDDAMQGRSETAGAGRGSVDAD